MSMDKVTLGEVRWPVLYGWPDDENFASDHTPARRTVSQLERDLKLSIVIPTLNQGDTIEDTILSILWQGHNNLEIIVMDGGSTDRTLAVLDQYRPWITRIVSRKDGGQSQAINQGFQLATGEILAWINSDDYYLPGSFQNVLDRFASDPEVLFTVGSGDVISKDHRFLRHIPALEMNIETMQNWIHDRWIMQQSCFWRRSLWDKVQGVDESLHLLMDFDLWFRFSKLTSACVISDTLAAMRYYPDAKTVKQKERFQEEMAYVFAKNGDYTSVRSFVANLVKEKSAAQNSLAELHSRWVIRLSKRLRLLPR